MNKLIELNDQLNGAPVGLLILFACIAIGYVFKIIKAFPNKAIPAIVIGSAAVLFMLAAPDKGATATRIWLVRNFCIGIVIGLCSWLSHKLVLKRIEKKLGLFLSEEETTIYNANKNLPDGQPLIKNKIP